MTNFYRRNTSEERASLLGPVAIAVVIAASVFGFDYVTGGVVREGARGASGAARSFTASAGVLIAESGFFSSKSALARENEELRQSLAVQTERIALADFVRRENEALAEMVRLARAEGGVTARVVSSLERSPYGTFVIAAGANDGVREGAQVLTEGGFLLGTITTVSGMSATVQSLFSPGVRNELAVHETVFPAEGRGGGNARAQVPRGSLIAIGDIAFATAFGRPAGQVLHIESASSSATAALSIRIPVNLDALKYVYVVIE